MYLQVFPSVSADLVDGRTAEQKSSFRSTTVTASSESSAIAQIKNKYPYVQDIRVMSVR